MNPIKQAIIDRANELQIDLIGFGSRERFAALPADSNPFTLFPTAQTAILIGRRITRGTLRGIEEGTNLGDYDNFGLHWLNDEFLSQCTYDLVCLLERSGWEAMPIVPGKSGAVQLNNGVPEVWPDFAYAAVACGLGEIGLGGFVLSKAFGPRQRFHLILTTAELPESPLLPEAVCDQCGECAAICPLQAIDVSRKQTVNMAGKVMTVAPCDPALCRECANGKPGLNDAHGLPDRIAMLCSRTCVEHLNQTGRIENLFRNPFRSRPAWVKPGEDV